MLRRLAAAAARSARTATPLAPPAAAAAPPPRWLPPSAAAAAASAPRVASPLARVSPALPLRGHASSPLAAFARPPPASLSLLARAFASTGGANGGSAAPAAPRAVAAPPPPAAPHVAPPPPGGVAWLQALQVDAAHPAKAILTAIPRRALCAETGLALRDLRVCDPSFRGQLPALLVRRGAIVVALEHLKAVITAERLLLFDAANPSVKQFLPDLLRTLSAPAEGDDAQGGGAHEAWPGAPPSAAGAWHEPAEPPFEFRALAALLDGVCTRLELRTHALAPEVQSLIAALQADAAAAALGRHVPLQLVRLNTELARLAADVEDVRAALAALLDEDVDMAGMYLSEARAAAPARKAAEHAEAEVLLEAFYRTIEEAASEVASLRDALRFTEGYVNTALDASRNALLRLDTLLTLGTLSLAAGGVVAAAFGMNLQSGLEAHPHAFHLACAAAATTSAAVFGGVWAGARSTLRAM